jgi:hypothetical protein
VVPRSTVDDRDGEAIGAAAREATRPTCGNSDHGSSAHASPSHVPVTVMASGSFFVDVDQGSHEHQADELRAMKVQGCK